eukprot:7746951-Ditylum_brightwellii.AAC.1
MTVCHWIVHHRPLALETRLETPTEEPVQGYRESPSGRGEDKMRHAATARATQLASPPPGRAPAPAN